MLAESVHYETLELTIGKADDAPEHQFEVRTRLIGFSPLERATVEIDLAALNRLRNDPVTYGILLGQALFQGIVGETYRAAVRNAEARGLDLRVRLVLEDEALQEIHWERLHVSKGAEALGNLSWTPLGTNARRPFSRYVLGATNLASSRVVGKRPLRVLVVIASPADITAHRLAPIPISERRAVHDAFSDPTTFAVTVLESDTGRPPTLNNIMETLEKEEPFHVLHVVCHGVALDGGTSLYLEKEDGSADLVAGSRFVNLFHDAQEPPRLCTFMACETALDLPQETTAAFTDLLPLGPDLVRNGNVEAVVAMTARVRMTTAGLFARTFYRRLARHGTVDVAMNEARSALFVENLLDWSVPVLFMRTANGQIWQPVPLPAAVRHAVRHASNLYVPRPEIEQAVIERLRAEGDRANVVCLYGLPGVGKTMLARKIAYDLEESFPDGTLWASLANTSTLDVLRRFVRLFDESDDYADYGVDFLRERLRRLLNNKRVLIVLEDADSGAQVQVLIPPDSPHIAVLVIATNNMPGLISRKQGVYVPEMTDAEAQQLLRNYGGDRLSGTSAATLHELAERSYFIPKYMLTMLNDCVQRRVRPADYLSRWTKSFDRRYWMEVETPALEGIYTQLAAEARAVLPYIGVMDEGRWDEEALLAVSKLQRPVIEAGLQQLLDIGFIIATENNAYRVNPLARDFARRKLNEMGAGAGEALVKVCQSLLAHYYLQLAEQVVRRHRRRLLHDYLQKPAQKRAFFDRLQQNMHRMVYESTRMEELAATQTDPTGTSLDPLQLTFEEIVLTELDFANRWSQAVGTGALEEEKQHLQDAVQRAAEREDWALVQQFTTLGNAGFLLYATFSEASGTIEMPFAVFHTCVFNESHIVSRLVAARLIDCTWNEGSLNADWLAVHIHNSTFNEVDLSGSRMPALIATNCTFNQVDLRRCDLRGALFRNCTFNECRFDGADLTPTTFLGTTFNDNDFTNVRGLDPRVRINLVANLIERQLRQRNLPPETGETIGRQVAQMRSLTRARSLDFEALKQMLDTITTELNDVEIEAGQLLEPLYGPGLL